MVERRNKEKAAIGIEFLEEKRIRNYYIWEKNENRSKENYRTRGSALIYKYNGLLGGSCVEIMCFKEEITMLRNPGVAKISKSKKLLKKQIIIRKKGKRKHRFVKGRIINGIEKKKDWNR